MINTKVELRSFYAKYAVSSQYYNTILRWHDLTDS